MTKDAAIAKGQDFISIGGSADKVGYVKSGLFKVSYATQKGDSRIRNFCRENTLISSYTNAIRGQPSEVQIQAIENSEVTYFKYDDLAKFFMRHPCWQDLARQLTEKYFSFRENREFQFLTKSAPERYDIFVAQFSGLKHRLTQVDIAAFIGITPVSLSRILTSKKVKE